MGAVYEAEHGSTGRRVAIKVILLAEETADPSLIQRFQREARAAGSIDTEHVVQVLDAGTDAASSRPYIVMELLHGEDLRQLLKRCRPVPPDVAVRIACQACAGLYKAHVNGVVHRDIKPGNLFLSRRENGAALVKLVDFGIAKLTAGEELTATGDVLGSPQYMSPEQVKQSKHLDHRTDIWSMGVVLYEMLAGHRPHAHCDNLGAMLLATCMEPAPPLRDVAPWVPPELAEVVHRALALRADDRPKDMSEWLDGLRRFAPDGLALRWEDLVPMSPVPVSAAEIAESPSVEQGVTTTSPLVARPAARPGQRHRAAVVAGATVFTAALAAVGAYRVARMDDSDGGPSMEVTSAAAAQLIPTQSPPAAVSISSEARGVESAKVDAPTAPAASPPKGSTGSAGGRTGSAPKAPPPAGRASASPPKPTRGRQDPVEFERTFPKNE